MKLNRTKKILLVLTSFCLFYSTAFIPLQNIPISWYCWKTEYKPLTALQNSIKMPNDYEKITVSENSFSQWLRFFPAKSIGGKVLLYNGKEKVNQSAQYAILDIDVGTKDLQQCADAVMRLRAEYLYSQKNTTKLNSTLQTVSNALTLNGYKVIVQKLPAIKHLGILVLSPEIRISFLNNI